MVLLVFMFLTRGQKSNCVRRKASKVKEGEREERERENGKDVAP